MEVVEDLKAKNLLSEEAERKLEEFGNLPRDLLDSWLKNAVQQPQGRRYSLEERVPAC